MFAFREKCELDFINVQLILFFLQCFFNLTIEFLLNVWWQLAINIASYEIVVLVDGNWRNVLQWYFAGQPEAEVINCTTGKDELGNPSRISKKGLFRRFYNLLIKLGARNSSELHEFRMYLDAKSSVEDYSVNFISMHLKPLH